MVGLRLLSGLWLTGVEAFYKLFASSDLGPENCDQSSHFYKLLINF